MSFSTFSFPTTVIYGDGAIGRLPEELERRRMQRPLLVTDRGLVQTAVLERVQKLVPEARVFSAVDPNPTEQNVLDGTACYTGQHCDSILALGGGSAIDAAKAIRLKATHP